MNEPRFGYHGHRMPEWMARTLPDHLVVADHDDPAKPFGTLIVRRRTEMYVPVPPAIPRQRAA